MQIDKIIAGGSANKVQYAVKVGNSCLPHDVIDGCVSVLHSFSLTYACTHFDWS